MIAFFNKVPNTLANLGRSNKLLGFGVVLVVHICTYIVHTVQILSLSIPILWSMILHMLCIVENNFAFALFSTKGKAFHVFLRNICLGLEGEFWSLRIFKLDIMRS
jgi:hypothetical protein